MEPILLPPGSILAFPLGNVNLNCIRSLAGIRLAGRPPGFLCDTLSPTALLNSRTAAVLVLYGDWLGLLEFAWLSTAYVV